MRAGPPLRRQPAAPGRQRGISLVVALIFLLAISLMGIAVVKSGSSEERMARADRDHTVALQAAEAAVRDAELDIRLSLTSGTGYTASGLTRSMAVNAININNFSCKCGSDLSAVQHGLCLPYTPVNNCNATYASLGSNPWEITSSWNPWTSNASVPLHTYTSSGTTTNLPLSGVVANGSSQLPRYMIEIVPNTDGPVCSAKLNVPCQSNRYRITARGWGPSGTYATVQETYQP